MYDDDKLYDTYKDVYYCPWCECDHDITLPCRDRTDDPLDPDYYHEEETPDAGPRSDES